MPLQSATQRDVLPRQHRNGERMMSTSSEPMPMQPARNDVRHAEHRNAGIGLVSSGVQYSAGDTNRDSRYSDDRVGRHRNGNGMTPTASELMPLQSARSDFRRTEHQNECSDVLPRQHRNGDRLMPTASEPMPLQSADIEMGDVRSAQHRNEDVPPRRYRSERSGLEPSGVQYSAGGTNHASQHSDVRVAEHQNEYSDVHHVRHRNGRSELAPSGVQHSAAVANYDFRSQSRYVYAGDYVPEGSGLALSGVQYSAGDANRNYQAQSHFVTTTPGHAGTAYSGVQNSAGVAGSVHHDANHDALVAAVVDSYGMRPERGVVNLTGVSYSVNDHHYDNDRNRVRDAIPIT
jgi:hypothetical protein